MLSFRASTAATLLAAGLWASGMDARALDPSSAQARSILSILQRRAVGPDEYTPHAAPVRWLALGDSYTAGPGAGDPWDPNDSSTCYRTKGSYAVQMRDNFPYETENEFTFISCSGHTTQDVIDSQFDIWPQEQQDFAVMTLGGNDAGFSKVVQVCILGIKGPDQTCDGAIDNAMVVLRSQDFEDRMNKVYDGIFERLGADYHNQLYHLQYPYLFSDQTEDDWCDTQNFIPVIGPYLDKDLRAKANKLAIELNAAIEWIAEKYVRDHQGTPERPPAPGWERNRLWTINPNWDHSPAADWSGHRFCEKDVHSLSDDNIFIIPWSGENAQLTIADFKQDSATCANDPKYGKDQGYTYDCAVAIDAKNEPDKFKDVKLMLPENYAKVFHPRFNGFTAEKNLVSSVIVRFRPSEKDQPVCENSPPYVNKTAIPENGDPGFVVTDNGPDPLPDPQCKIGGGGSQKTCKLSLEEKYTCDPDQDKNLRAFAEVWDGDKSLGRSGDPSSIGPVIGNAAHYELRTELPNPVVIIGQHVGDVVQLHYADLSWDTSVTTEGDAPYCTMTADWDSDKNCDPPFQNDINYVTAKRDFECFFKCS